MVAKTTRALTSQLVGASCSTSVVTWVGVELLLELLEGRGELVVVRAGCTVILFVALVATARERTSNLLEFVKSLHGQCGHAVMLGGGVVRLVNRHGSVDDFGLDCLLVDDRHNRLMDVMVNVLSSHCGSSGLCGMDLGHGGMVLEFGQIGRDSLLSPRLIIMMIFAVLCRDNVVDMFLGQNLLVLKRLHCGVVMMLMDLTVNSLRHFFMLVRFDGLVGDGGVHCLLDCGMMAPVAGKL